MDIKLLADSTAVIMVRANIRRAIMIALFAAALMPCRVMAEVSSDTAIKAAYLYKFGFFVEWPSNAFAAADSPLTLCVVGDDSFRATLDAVVKGQQIGKHSILVHKIESISRDSGCHVLYLSATMSSRAPQIIASLRGSDVLTVTDAGTSDSDVGMINFVIKDNRVRFDIDDEAAAAAGLSISSRLLNLAIDVKHRH